MPTTESASAPLPSRRTPTDSPTAPATSITHDRTADSASPVSTV